MLGCNEVTRTALCVEGSGHFDLTMSYVRTFQGTLLVQRGDGNHPRTPPLRDDLGPCRGLLDASTPPKTRCCIQ